METINQYFLFTKRKRKMIRLLKQDMGFYFWVGRIDKASRCIRELRRIKKVKFCK